MAFLRPIKVTLAGCALGMLAASAMAAPPAPAAPPPPASVQLDRAQIEGLIRAYLLDNPEIIPEAMQRLEERQRNESVAELRAQLEKPFEGAWIGNPEADVVVVEFFDYACGYCRRMAGDIERLVAEDSKVKIVFREFPILGPGSVEAARTALQAARSGGYTQFHRDIFAAGPLTKASLQKVAKKGKIKLPKDMTALDAELSANRQMARQLGINGTPAFIIAGRFVSGAIGYDGLKEQVAAARAAAAKAAPK
jgi:protein-disulfide isomerase